LNAPIVLRRQTEVKQEVLHTTPVESDIDEGDLGDQESGIDCDEEESLNTITLPAPSTTIDRQETTLLSTPVSEPAPEN
jgi:hypothetical protein